MGTTKGSASVELTTEGSAEILAEGTLGRSLDLIRAEIYLLPGGQSIT